MQEGIVLRNNYRLDRLLGRGGMADVYLAFDTRRQTYVAIKVLREDLAEDPEFVRRFTREADALARLDHPNVVRFYSFERQGASAFIVMDYVPGSTLQRRIAESSGPLPLEEITRILRQIGPALQYAHHEGYVHRDVKPGNIMLREDGTALLSDFGIARAAESATLMTGTIGTPAYMSPEQIRGHDLDSRSDIYSLGIVLYEIASGRRPFTGDERGVTGTGTLARLREAHLKLNPPDPRSHNPSLSAGPAAVILRALAKEPGDRWPDVRSLVKAWDAAVGTAAPEGLMTPRIGSSPAPIPALTTPSTPRTPTPPPVSATPAGVMTPPRGEQPATARKGGSGLVLPLLGVVGLAAVAVLALLGWRLISSLDSGSPQLTTKEIESTAQALAVVIARATTEAGTISQLVAPTSTSRAAAAATATPAPATNAGGGLSIVTLPSVSVERRATASPQATDTAAAADSVATATPRPPSPTPAPKASQASFTVKEGEVNLRGGPGTNYAIVGKAQAGTTYAVSERTAAGDWLRLDGAAERWVAAAVVEASGDAPVAAKLPATPAVAAVSQTPILLEPVDGFTLWPYNTATFKFKWNGRALGPNEGFELRIWKEGNPDHPGAAPPVKYVATANHVYEIYIGSIRATPGVVDISTTDWINVYWTVAVVQLEPYRRSGPEAKPFWIHT